MRKTLSTLTVFAACAMLISSCAPFAPPPAPAQATPPRRVMPATATEPCKLDRLPDNPTQSDLELSYAVRGAGIIACDARRALAVDVHAAEHADEDAWLAKVTPRAPFWRRVLGLSR